MKRLLLFLLLLTPSSVCLANHCAGVDIYYTYVGGNTYRIGLTIYGACNDLPNHNYSSLYGASPQILIIDSVTHTTFKTLSLNYISDSTRDVSPYCTKYLDSTNCQLTTSTLQGFTRFMYSDTVTLPSQSAKWIFRFTSATNPGCSGRMGRPNPTTNLVGGSGANIVLEAMLNNTAGNNSSPTFNSSTFSAYCINVLSSYNQQVHEPDHDSLYYQLVAPQVELNTYNCLYGTPLAYAPGYNPLATIANGFNFNSSNGAMVFMANTIQVSAIDTRIYEYRNGVLMGYVTREKIFKILGTCNTTPPLADIDTSVQSLQGAVWYHDSVIACPGSVIHFNIPVSDIYGDTITASVSNIPAGSNLTINNNNTKTPAIHFTWNTAGVSPGTYTFYGDYQANACPLKTESLMSYTIVISDGGSITPTVLSATNCIQKATVKYDVSSPFYPFTFTILDGTNVVKSYTGNAPSSITDSLAPGNYILRISSQGVPCPGQISFLVKDSGLYPYPPVAVSPINYCRNADALALDARVDSGSLSGTVFSWYDDHGNFISNNAPIPSTAVGGKFTYYVREQYKTCVSEADSVLVTIDSAECNYDITIHNAITPNGDGKNDKWIIDNLGYYPNMVVQVFDKLGDKVFEKTNYQNDWDGGNLPSGVYYYLIRLNGQNKTSGTENFTGFLMIKR